MVTVTALKSFDHGGAKRRGDKLSVSLIVAKRLRDAGLVSFPAVPKSATPQQANGKPSSASPAAQASPQTTAKKSGRGRWQKRGAALSSSTPVSE